MTNIITHIKFAFVFLIFLQTDKCGTIEKNEAKATEVENTEHMDSMQNSSSLQKIHLRRYGGMMGHEENLIVTKDSTTYTFQNREIHKPKSITIATPTDKWGTLIQLFDEEELSNLQDGEMKVAFDGIDNVFVLEGDFKTQTVRNPIENPTGLNPFFEYINTERTKLFDQIRKE